MSRLLRYLDVTASGEDGKSVKFLCNCRHSRERSVSRLAIVGSPGHIMLFYQYRLVPGSLCVSILDRENRKGETREELCGLDL